MPVSSAATKTNMYSALTNRTKAYIAAPYRAWAYSVREWPFGMTVRIRGPTLA
jgi:hypothetical protein